MRKKTIATSLIGFAAGLTIGSFWNLGQGVKILFFILGAVFIALFFISFSGTKKNFPIPIFLVSIFFFSLAFGLWRYDFGANQKESALLKNSAGKYIVLEAKITEEPDERENLSYLVAKTADGKILITANRYPLFYYGDIIEIKGILRRPQNISDFDWKSFLAKEDIYFEMFKPQINLLARGQGSKIKEGLFSVKEKFLANISRIIPEPQAAFIGGITVGARKSIPKSLQEAFVRTGVIHIVVLSGYNVTIIAESIMRFFRIFPFVWRAAPGLAGLSVILFALMTGASPSIIRASIMALIVIIARATGRIYATTAALGIAGFFMVLQNPKILRFDLSFQLSFLATLGLIFLAGYFEKVFWFLPQNFKIRESAASSTAAQIAVLPLLLHATGNISFISLPTNILILIFMPLTMFFGFLAGILGFLGGWIALPFAWIAYGFSTYAIAVVNFFSGLPFAFLKAAPFPLWLMILIYAGYIIALHKLNKNAKINSRD